MQLKRKINSLEDLLEYVNASVEKRKIVLRCAELLSFSRLSLGALYFDDGKFDELPRVENGDFFARLEADYALLGEKSETKDLVRSDAHEKNIFIVAKNYVRFQVFDISGASVFVIEVRWAGEAIGVALSLNRSGRNMAREDVWIEILQSGTSDNFKYTNHDLGYSHTWDVSLKTFCETFDEMMRPFGVVDFFKNENC